MTRIAIVGYGFVGRLYAGLFAHRYEAQCIDEHGSYLLGRDSSAWVGPLNDLFAKPAEARLALANACDLSVICLPTPQADKARTDSPADTSIIEWWLERLTTPLILIKSTVPPGSTVRWREKYGKRIVFSPEFGGESSYYTNEQRYLHPTKVETHPFVVLSGPDEDTVPIQQLLLPILGPEKEYIFVRNSSEAEMMKYVINSWGAMKVTIWNEYFEMCQRLGLNFHAVRELALKDRRIEPMHTAVFEGKRGFGGRCFLKDTAALLALMAEHDYVPTMLKQAVETNAVLNPEGK